MVFDLVLIEIRQKKSRIIKMKVQKNEDILTGLEENMGTEKQRAIILMMMKEASAWLNTLPIKSEGFGSQKTRIFYCHQYEIQMELEIPTIKLCM